MKVPAIFKNVTIESTEGSFSSKDSSKFYGSCVIKYRDSETNKKGSIPIRVNTQEMLDVLTNYEVEDTLLNVSVEIEQNKFDPKTFILGNIVECELVDVA